MASATTAKSLKQKRLQSLRDRRKRKRGNYVRSIEEVLRTKTRKKDELDAQIKILEAAAQIMEAEEPLSGTDALFRPARSNGEPAGISASIEPRGIPNTQANPMATQPPPEEKREVRRWP
jgi:hypothetical protein